MESVVVTGIGMLTPLGIGVEKNWQQLISGSSGIRKITHIDTESMRAKVVGRVWDYDGGDYFSTKELRRYDKFIQYGIVAGREAMSNADLDKDTLTNLSPFRAGVTMGSGIGGMQGIIDQYDVATRQGVDRISPFFVPGTILNMISGILAIEFGMKGPNVSLVSACATGSHNIIFAAQCIQTNQADIMLAGASEYTSCSLGLGGFSAMRALSANKDPVKACRPWDKNRDGFVLSDGAAALVLESKSHALRRGATILAELPGYSMQADAYHTNQPDPSGDAARYCIEKSLEAAKLDVADIGYINAHATSTPLGDQIEPLIVKQLFGQHANNLCMSSTKSMTGHMLGAAGAAEAIYTIKALQQQIAPPTINLDEPDDGCDLDLVAHSAKKKTMKHAISNSFGFGGTNTSLVFSKTS